MNVERKLWIDKQEKPVITWTSSGDRNAERWGWTPAVAIPAEEALPETQAETLADRDKWAAEAVTQTERADRWMQRALAAEGKLADVRRALGTGQLGPKLAEVVRPDRMKRDIEAALKCGCAGCQIFLDRAGWQG